MRKGVSTTIKSSRSAATPDALLALVRLLARQAAREFVLDTPAQPDITSSFDHLVGLREQPMRDG
jgi:hypothetical protein